MQSNLSTVTLHGKVLKDIHLIVIMFISFRFMEETGLDEVFCIAEVNWIVYISHKEKLQDIRIFLNF